jgi:hypothetical protein
MTTYQFSLSVVVEADTLEEAVSSAREDLARYAHRGTVTVCDLDADTEFSVEPDGTVTS